MRFRLYARFRGDGRITGRAAIVGPGPGKRGYRTSAYPAIPLRSCVEGVIALLVEFVLALQAGIVGLGRADGEPAQRGDQG